MPAGCQPACRCQCGQQGCECWDGMVDHRLPDGRTLRLGARKAT